MRKRCFALLLLVAISCWAAVPTPQEHLGYIPGDDYKLADYKDLSTYFHKLASASDRIKVVEFGKSALGKPMLVAFLSDAENLKQLERYRDINRRLALGLAGPEEARRLAMEGKAIVWIDSGLHASEVAPAQHSFDLAYRMITNEDEETRRIRKNVILLQIPVINPDGLDWIAHWYRGNVGTPYELAPMPRLYQKYAGHDNNRDFYMLNLVETQAVTRMLFEEWFPQIVYNQHQQPAFPARIFVPPYAEPLNPHIPAPVMEGINLVGAAMKERFARENKPGVLSYYGFDAWWNGGLRSVPAFHNMHGILTETAANGYGTPRTYNPAAFPERFANGMPTKEPTVFYERPWMGGKWTVRHAADYMLTADFAILDLASTRSYQFLYKAWETAHANIVHGEEGKPYAYIVPAGQWDTSSALEMLRRLRMGGIEVHRARAEFRAGGKSYPAGSFVLKAGQAFRPYLVDLMEAQKYPELRSGTSGPAKRPYDVAGWTLHMLMGVRVDRIDDKFDASLEAMPSISGATAGTLDARENASFLTIADLLAKGARVWRGSDGVLLTSAASGAVEIKRPRLGVYEPWIANMDTGWTTWVLDNYRVPHTLLHNDDMRAGNLRAKFDTLIFAAQSASSILHGYREGEPSGRARAGEIPTLQRPEYTGGIGIAGLEHLQQFVREGGTLIAMDSATELPAQFFPLPVRSLIRTSGEEESRESEAPSGGYYSPGSLLRVTVDASHPLATGMPKETTVFTTGGQAWEITLAPDYNKGDREVKPVVKYAGSNLLASGYLSGERTVAGRNILLDARFGKGRVVLFGFRPQFRGQTFGTFKLLLNAIYM